MVCICFAMILSSFLITSFAESAIPNYDEFKKKAEFVKNSKLEATKNLKALMNDEVENIRNEYDKIQKSLDIPLGLEVVNEQNFEIDDLKFKVFYFKAANSQNQYYVMENATRRPPRPEEGDFRMIVVAKNYTGKEFFDEKKDMLII
jgi:hypothetical protein